jgi:hypothetical protein
MASISSTSRKLKAKRKYGQNTIFRVFANWTLCQLETFFRTELRIRAAALNQVMHNAQIKSSYKGSD